MLPFTPPPLHTALYHFVFHSFHTYPAHLHLLLRYHLVDGSSTLPTLDSVDNHGGLVMHVGRYNLPAPFPMHVRSIQTCL